MTERRDQRKTRPKTRALATIVGGLVRELQFRKYTPLNTNKSKILEEALNV